MSSVVLCCSIVLFVYGFLLVCLVFVCLICFARCPSLFCFVSYVVVVLFSGCVFVSCLFDLLCCLSFVVLV